MRAMEAEAKGKLTDFDRRLHAQLQPFLDAGLLTQVPNKWQITQGACQMAPYVVFPDDDDAERYKGAPMGHPILRTPLVLYYVGLDHFHIGSGLGARKKSIIKHLNIVHHQEMPDYDLQLLQLHKDGLDQLARYTKELDNRKAKQSIKRDKRLIDKVLPNARHYRNEILKTGGFIDRARRLDYTPDSQIPSFLRAEFFSLVRFLEWCNSLPAHTPALQKPWALLRHVGTIFRKG
tara:strand:- start:713 stop:1414 length:702 start_codon:yes stop_codon:yes gene_type:complete